ncbi:hypothetical protein [Pseudophaeobacter arcticus]|uniref:hypothetical protein n=1 Tax=Pseudophaeobacter arcticus TaxID=385492 RepID=UPI00248FD2C5|nr:hypothetical protein [Pseudophaeobacter arcticus]
MRQPTITKTISLGTILNLATILTSLAFAWGQLNTRISVTEETISRLDGRVVTLDDFQRREDQIDRSRLAACQ